MITYSAWISADEKDAVPQRALQLFEAKLHRGLLPDVITYSALISACAKGTLPREPCSSSKQFCTKASCQT